MNKEDYVQLHTLLAKLKYELEFLQFETNSEEFREELKRHIKSVDDLMLVFIVECE